MAGFWGKRTSIGVLAAILALQGAAGATVSSPRMKPPAPGPEYLTRLDHARLLTIHSALEKKQYSIARAETKFVADPTARSLAQWLYLMAKDQNVDLADADAFLDAHPDWPATDRIQSFVEGRMSNETSTDAIRSFFRSRAPRTGDGKIQLARALLSEGQSDKATELIRDAWVNHNFTVSQERRILNAYKSRLTKENHAARVDRLLWGIQVTNARRTFPYLSGADRRMAEARAALLMRSSTAPRLYRNLPKSEQVDSGVLHAAVRYYRRTDQQDYAISLAAKAPDKAETLRDGDRWWTERRILMQWALKEGRFSDAYRLAAEHGGAEGTDFSDAEFVAGWIALRFLDEPERATTHFEAMTGAVATPISLSRGYYWLGRAAAAGGNETAARDYYATAAEHHYSYYGQLAAEALGGAAVNKSFAAPTVSSPADKARFNSRPAVAALRMLSDLNLDYEFMVFAYHVDDELDRPGEFIELARLTNGEGAPHLTVRAGKVATQRGAFTPHVAYPTVFVPDEARAFVSPEIILGLSRQESEFNPRAFSSAGARGVMQLIPSTAQITARKEGLPYRRAALLDDPVYNMTLGSAHLSHLLDRFDGSLVMTFAAYNAGAHRATRWAEEYGDPRTGDVDPVDWVELIPFSETRNYVQRVLENTQVYRSRLNASPIPGRLGDDIERGGPKGRIAATRAPSARLAALAQSRGGVGALADLPAQTALNAAAFREQRLAALTPPAAPQSVIDDDLVAQPVRKPETSQRPDRRVSPAITPEIAPNAAPAASDATPAIQEASDDEVGPTPSALSTPDTAATADTDNAKTENIVTQASPAPQPPITPAITSVEPVTALPSPEETADPIADLMETAIAASAATDLPAESTDTEDQSKSEFADKIIRKAATRLQIEDEGDALAAAIVRGLEQMELENGANAEPGCDAVAALAPNEDDAAALNALMAAQLRGEDEPCAE